MTDITLPPTDLVVFMRRFDTEFWNTGDVAAADDMMAENLIHTFPAGWPSDEKDSRNSSLPGETLPRDS